MLKRITKNLILALVATAPIVLASVPQSKRFSSDTAIYQNLHEVRLSPIKHADLEARIDADFEKLSATEKKHRTRVMPLRISAPMDRVLKAPYSPQLKQERHRAR